MKKNHIIISTIIFFASILIYTLTSSGTVAFGDSGEFIIASYRMAILHPPGYPIYSILGRIFSLLPLGTIAFRINLMSAFFASLTLVFLYLIIIKLTDNIYGAIISVTSLLFAETFWYYAHYAKGYTLNLFFLSVMIYCALKIKENKRYFYLWGLCFALSCTYHYQSTIILIPAFLYYFITIKKLSVKDILLLLPVILAGLLPYIFLPLKAINSPHIYHWGDPTTISGFIEMITGKMYGWHEATQRSGIENTIHQLTLYGKFLLQQFNLFGIISGIFGLIILAKEKKELFIFTLLIYISNVLAVSYIITTQIDIFLEAILPGLFLPSHLIFSIWIGWAGFKLWRKKQNLVYFMFIVPLLSLYMNYHSGYEKNNFIALNFAKNCLSTVEKNSILITSGDNDTFPLWYIQQVENYRPDVKILTMGLIGEKNYEKYIREELNIPWDEELSTGIDKKDAVKIFVKKYSKCSKIYLTYYGASQLPELNLAPRGILYEVTDINEKLDLIICNDLIKNKYLLNGISDRNVYKDFLTSSMIGPYAKAYYDLGVLCINENMPDKAIENFNKIEKIDYSLRPDIKEEFKKAVEFQRGRVETLKGNWDKALNLVEDKEEMFKNSPSFYLTRGILYREKSIYDKSLIDFNKALSLDSKSARIYLEMGKLYYKAGDIKEALYKLTIALQLDKTIPEGHYWLGKTYEKYNLKEKAIEKYREELKLYPDNKLSIEALKEIH